jgi:hypothetical protein
MEMWQDKMRRLEAHGEELKLALVFRINALRMLMAGNAKEFVGLWLADHDTTDQAKSYHERLTQVKDYLRRRHLDSSVKEKMQHGGDPVDLGTVGGRSWVGVTGGGYRTTKDTVSTHSASKSQARAKAQETLTSADHQGPTEESAPTSPRATAKAMDSRENVTIVVKGAIPQGSAQKSKNEEGQKEKKKTSKRKVKIVELASVSSASRRRRTSRILAVGSAGTGAKTVTSYSKGPGG